MNKISCIDPRNRFYKTMLKSTFFAEAGINSIKLKIGVKTLSWCTVVEKLKCYLVELVLVLLSIILCAFLPQDLSWKNVMA